jgi:type IV pilus assembly protein PilQ
LVPAGELKQPTNAAPAGKASSSANAVQARAMSMSASLVKSSAWAHRRLLMAALLGLLVGCQGPKAPPPRPASGTSPAPSPPASAPEAAPRKPEAQPAGAKPPAAEFIGTQDEALKAILQLARRGRWEEAELQAAQQYEMNPQDPAVQRVYSWIKKQREQSRNRTLEDQIREIEANNSVFNPTIPDLLKENKDRGLAPRKDVRDVIDQIESTPYIPPTYGRTNYQTGPLFDFSQPEGRMAKILDKEVSVRLDNVTLESIIFNVGQAEGINFVADKALPAFTQKLSVNLEKVKLREFLAYISRNLDLQFQVGNDLIWVIDAKDPKKLQEETRFYRLRKGFVLPAQYGPTEITQTRTTTPQNVTTVQETQKIEKFVNDGTPDMPSIEKAITNLFTGSKYLIDYERNLIVARGTREQLEVLEKIIQEFDKSIQQVLIEARFITVSQPAFLQLGVLWETGRRFTVPRSPTDFTGLVGSDNISRVGIGIQETITNVFGASDLSATISALEQSGESQTLSAPRLTVLNNRPATISDGKIQYYYEEYTVTTTLTERTAASSFLPKGKPARITAGVELDVLASISGDGQSILLALRPRVNQDVKLVTFATLSDVDPDTGDVTSTFDIRLPEYRTQELSTRVVVRSGETVVMGGVLEREQSTYVESVPVLGSIPIIGPLFRRRTELDRPRYLLVFVTATIVSETGEFVIYQSEER